MGAFPREQYLVLTGLEQAGGASTIRELAERSGVDQALLSAGARLLAERALVELIEEPYREFVLKEAGRAAAAGGLPERKIVNALREAGKALSIQELPAPTGLAPREIGATLRVLSEKKWAVKDGPLVRLTGALAGPPRLGPDEALLQALAGRAEGRAVEADLAREGIALEEALALLKTRREWLETKTRRVWRVTLTAEGRRELEAGAREAREATQLTPELLASGAWREVSLKAYDIQLGVTPVFPGKLHPLQRVVGETRRIFLEMGFTEIVSPMVESSFWNFDALFQPQDHPAREMQDTFYLERPGELALPADAALVERVRRTHEDGGDTGSIGWGHSWDAARARTAVLRTHTTAATVRALAEDPRGPRKVFCVGRVFRREAIDYKHLPLFHQVDGIIIDAQATFANLLGTLTAFYRKMGFERIELRPGFFPYTEPSVEVFIWVPQKQDWFEMGGAGIFRPEVTRPLGCEVPVLAWGLGLERLAMLRYDVLEMRKLYQPDLEWLKEVPLCR